MSSAEYERPKEGAPHLLLAEGDPILGAGLRDFFSEKGYVVSYLKEGTSVVSALSSAAPDLLILSIRLPLMDGFTILQQMKREGSEVPVIVLSTLKRVQERNEALGLGADAYLTKPFNFEELAGRVERILQNDSA